MSSVKMHYFLAESDLCSIRALGLRCPKRKYITVWQMQKKHQSLKNELSCSILIQRIKRTVKSKALLIWQVIADEDACVPVRACVCACEIKSV